MQKTRDHPNSRSGYVKEDVLKAISGFFIILAFIAVISLFAGMGGSSGGTSNSGSSDSKVIFVVNDMLLEAPKDTTWEEFVSNESINTPGFTIVDDNVYLGDSKVIDSETNLPVTPDMPIDSNIEYKDESYIGDSDNGSDSGSDNSATLITFTIDGTTYQAEEGMTWDEWMANTIYNIDGYQRHCNLGNSVSDPNTGFCVGVNGNYYLGSVEIVDGYAYTTEYVNTSGGAN